ncbi:ATP-binding protein [Paenibacillus sp. ISL-20]|uniref:ATP-binding protein n=1 Tax=Paenibacillus sp. ISL-20 TaxID=2819163 RepID=UPI001BE62DAF|nr:ATP-binding protein [Paenibacillus sp. ISL-20]MBT2765917.1 hypothetical protein [Paenibacillus sp. ISL-20]
MSIEWNYIRTFNKSQNNAFEELVCQLAREEEISEKKEFYRVAAPDGGVEAYCVLNNGDEHAWQAKYFSTMGNSQWNQLNESFETAIRTHPNLTKYYICIPLDRQDPRREKQMWFMDRWKEKVHEWTEYAQEKGRNISIEYWGSSELIHRLSQKKHAGRTRFWFSQHEFTDEWFKNNVEYSIANLGERYTPELNVELEVSKAFDFMSRNESFRNSIKQTYHVFLLALNKAINQLSKLPLENDIQKLLSVKENLEMEYLTSQKEGINQINILTLNENIETLEDALSHCESYIDSNRKKTTYTSDYTMNSVNNLWNAVYDFSVFLRGSLIKLANTPIALLSGPAGIGKSHLLADVALNKIKENKSCLLILGQHFASEDNPWTQILRNLLRIQCNENELLGALNAKAEAEGERLLFIIDAVNEGRGRYFWPEHINGFINEFKKYPWLGLVLSIRSSYEKLIAPDNFISDNNIVKLNHFGFEGLEYLASSSFFMQYGLEQPSIPLLHPEFSNPLFLKLFCEGLQRSGLTKMPKGFSGISNIIDFFIDSVDNKLSKPSLFDYPNDRKLVRKVIDKLIEYKLNKSTDMIAYEVAFEIADEQLSKFSNKRRFLDALISEGILSKNLVWHKDNNNYEEFVYLAYERFEDHLTTSHLLDVHLDPANPETIFQEHEKLADYIDNSHQKQGILEALAVQIPERIGKEFYELLNEQQKNYRSVKESFINSLIWRRPETIKDGTRDYVNQFILTHRESRDLFFQMAYSVCIDPKHFYNADRFHEYMMKFSLAQRDSFWTTYLHDQNHDGSAMRRLINWSMSSDDKSYLLEEVRVLAAKSLGWLFTSTDIHFRDLATKALVVLLENNLSVSKRLLIAFEEVNDAYVYERIFAASYGAVLRSDNMNGLEQLSIYIINNIFNKDEVYPNVLVRDYARNIVEFAQYKGVIKLNDINIVRPPYRSHFPVSFPTNEEIDSYKAEDQYGGRNEILSSMVTEYGRGIAAYGDFGRYVFQSKVNGWDKFDPNDLSNYACQLIFEKYGYDAVKHGLFDRHSNKGDRYKNKKERIGKKYQWIALYEVLARLSDNFKMRDQSYWGKRKKYIAYQGPWEPFIRNIDPTAFSLSTTVDYNLLDNGLQKYSDWDGSNEDWLIRDSELPDPQALISITDTAGEEWLVLERNLSWKELLPIGQDRNETPYKRLWYQIRSYLVKEEMETELLGWLKEQHLIGRWFPEGYEQYQVFSREFYWSPAYRHFNNTKPAQKWEKIYKNKYYGSIIAEVLPTSEGHRWESGLDEEKNLSYLAPREYIYSSMKLQYSKNVGEWLDEKGKVTCFDHSVKTGGSLGLLIKKDSFVQFLTENKLKVFWTCLGEKQVIGDSFNDRYNKWLELSGVYSIHQGNVDGELKIFKQQVN